MPGMARGSLTLGIDSATPFLSLALWSPEAGLLASRHEEVGRGHTARILVEIEHLFQQCARRPGELQAIVVGIGPGSYTGLRVGVATAKGLSRALSIPLWGCDTLAAIAFTALQEGETGAAVLDARRGNVYAGIYRKKGVELATISDPRKLPRSTLIAERSDLRIIERRAPDAGYIASSASRRLSPRPLYL